MAEPSIYDPGRVINIAKGYVNDYYVTNYYEQQVKRIMMALKAIIMSDRD